MSNRDKNQEKRKPGKEFFVRLSNFFTRFIIWVFSEGFKPIIGVHSPVPHH